jgi:UDP-2,3-diacylglucosamine hydrolase
MRLVTLSDIHIRELNDIGHQCLNDFLAHPLTRGSTHVGLLGDIFDLMAGDHAAYVERFREIFEAVGDLCREGKVVYFAEGNHDMHLDSLFKRLSKGWGIEAAHRLQVIPSERLIEIAGRQIVIGHGDEYNLTDLTYLKYKAFIKKPWLAFVADHVMPLAILDYVGHRASKTSRAYGHRTYNEEEVRQKFRAGVESKTPNEAQVVIGGHSHVVDEYAFQDKLYLNNGFPPKSRKFIAVDSEGARLVNF